MAEVDLGLPLGGLENRTQSRGIDDTAWAGREPSLPAV